MNCVVNAVRCAVCAERGVWGVECGVNGEKWAAYSIYVPVYIRQYRHQRASGSHMWCIYAPGL